jgi:hypothetical protein
MPSSVDLITDSDSVIALLTSEVEEKEEGVTPETIVTTGTEEAAASTTN